MSLPHLCEAHFVVSDEVMLGSFARRVRTQLPRSSAAGLLRFSESQLRSGGWYSEFFDNPELAHLHVLEWWEREDSPGDGWGEWNSGEEEDY